MPQFSTTHVSTVVIMDTSQLRVTCRKADLAGLEAEDPEAKDVDSINRDSAEAISSIRASAVVITSCRDSSISSTHSKYNGSEFRHHLQCCSLRGRFTLFMRCDLRQSDLVHQHSQFSNSHRGEFTPSI